MPFSDFRLMAVALVVIAGCALATTLRSFGFTRWFPPKVRRLVQKCRAKLKRKPKAQAPAVDTQQPYEQPFSGYTFAYLDEVDEPKPLGRPRTKRRKKKD
jgi:hypothetical protein